MFNKFVISFHSLIVYIRVYLFNEADEFDDVGLIHTRYMMHISFFINLV